LSALSLKFKASSTDVWRVLGVGILNGLQSEIPLHPELASLVLQRGSEGKFHVKSGDKAEF
jgi:hypothetical protein